MRKMGAAASAGFIILYVVLMLFLYIVIEAPLLMIIGVGLIFLAVGIILIYQVFQRFKEIDRGQDDAVDDY